MWHHDDVNDQFAYRSTSSCTYPRFRMMVLKSNSYNNFNRMRRLWCIYDVRITRARSNNKRFSLKCSSVFAQDCEIRNSLISRECQGCVFHMPLIKRPTETHFSDSLVEQTFLLQPSLYFCAVCSFNVNHQQSCEKKLEMNKLSSVKLSAIVAGVHGSVNFLASRPVHTTAQDAKKQTFLAENDLTFRIRCCWWTPRSTISKIMTLAMITNGCQDHPEFCSTKPFHEKGTVRLQDKTKNSSRRLNWKHLQVSIRLKRTSHLLFLETQEYGPIRSQINPKYIHACEIKIRPCSHIIENTAIKRWDALIWSFEMPRQFVAGHNVYWSPIWNQWVNAPFCQLTNIHHPNKYVALNTSKKSLLKVSVIN